MVAAIVVAAGKGVRAGASDKVLRKIAGRSVIARAVAPFLEDSRVTQIVIVAPAGCEAEYLAAAFPDGLPADPAVRAVAGGERRQDSVASGLAALEGDPVLVAVHDAARPLHRPEVLNRLIDTALTVGGAIPVIPLADTVLPVDATSGLVSGTLDRTFLRLVQTPQVFRRDWLDEAHAAARDGALEATDDASLVLAVRHPVAYVAGSGDNLKITTAVDFEIAETLLKERAD